LDVAEGDLVASDQIAMFAGVCSTHRVLVLVSSADVATAVQAIRHGAAEVIQKPFEHCSILERIKQLVSTTS
jgi:FixJ family two-component response regulator